MKKVILYPATVLATGFTYGLLEGLLALGFRPGGVTPAENLLLSLIHRCLFYAILSAVIGALTFLAAAAVARARSHRGPSPARAAAAAMLGCALAANLFWTVIAIS